MSDQSGLKHNQKVVTRMPPSPTGHLHIGTARTALFNYLFTKKHDGKIILRSEDTDKKRSSREYEDEIREGLAWLGMEFDAFYRQSERASIYREYLEAAIEKGSAYVSREESKQEPGKEVEVVRLKNPNKKIQFNDEVRGNIEFDTTELGDIVIARSIDDALYHFTVVVDDHEMGVTHVIRGEDHISNTPRQILIQEAIGATRPVYAHIPLILAPDRSKLSKRNGTVALREYQNEGFLPAALINYLALLGWNPGTDQEIFTFAELIGAFDFAGVQKGGAIFNKEKLRWINKEHLTKYSDEEFASVLTSYTPQRVTMLPQYSTERLSRLLPELRERTEVFGDIEQAMENGEYDFAFSSPQIDPTMIKWKKDNAASDALPRLKRAVELLGAIDDLPSAEDAKGALWSYAEEVGKGELLWPLRVALTGQERSPDPFSVISILGKEESLTRIEAACATISSA